MKTYTPFAIAIFCILFLGGCKKPAKQKVRVLKGNYYMLNMLFKPGGYWIYNDELGNQDSLYVYRVDTDLTYRVDINDDTFYECVYCRSYYRDVDLQSGQVISEYTDLITPWGIRRNVTDPDKPDNGQWVFFDTLQLGFSLGGTIVDRFIYHQWFCSNDLYNCFIHKINYQNSTTKVFPSDAEIDWIKGKGYTGLRYTNSLGIAKSYSLCRDHYLHFLQ